MQNIAIVNTGMSQDSSYEHIVVKFYANDRYIRNFNFSLVLISELSLFLRILFGRKIPHMVLYGLKT